MIKNDNSSTETISCSSLIKRKRNTCLGAVISQKVGQGEQSSPSRLYRKHSKDDKFTAGPADEVMTPMFVYEMEASQTAPLLYHYETGRLEYFYLMKEGEGRQEASSCILP